jgi:hypothetical protein
MEPNLQTFSALNSRLSQQTAAANSNIRRCNLFLVKFIFLLAIRLFETTCKIKEHLRFDHSREVKTSPEFLSRWIAASIFSHLTQFLKPDFERFGMPGLDRDTCRLLSKRVVDLAGWAIFCILIFWNMI